MRMPKRCLGFLLNVLLVASIFSILFMNVWQIKPAQATTGSFGDTNIETGEMGSDTKFACRFQAPASGTVTDMSFYTEDLSSDANGIDLAVYSDNTSAPNVPLGYNTTTDVGGLAWYNATGLSVTIVLGTYYWLTASQTAGGNTYRCKYKAGAVNQTATAAAGRPPSNPFGTPTFSDREISIYANYTEGGGDTTSPTYSNIGTNSVAAWANKTVMTAARADIPCVVYNSLLYIFGGYGTSSSDVRAEVYAYDPSTDSWSTKTSMTYIRWGAAAAAYSGLIYVFGGVGSGDNRVEAYNVSTNSWDTKSNLPTNLTGYSGIMAVTVSSKIYLFYQNFTYQYDPSTDLYTQKANSTGAKTWATCGYVQVAGEDRIYLIGGYDYSSGTPTNVNYYYRPDSNDWSSAQAVAPYSAYGVLRDNPVDNGLIYYGYGFDGASTFYPYLYAYNASVNTWGAALPSPSFPRDGVGCGFINGKLYVVGGRNVSASPYGVNFNEEFSTDSVSSVLSFNCKWTDETGLATTGGYIVGTNNTGTFNNETWIAFTANPNWANITKTLNVSASLVQYEWWANDTNNNWNNTGIQNFYTTPSATYNLTINSIPVAVTYAINGTGSGYSITASSGNPSDVQNAISTVLNAGGGTVNIPAGNWGWNQTNPANIIIDLTSLSSGTWLNIIGAGGQVNTTTRMGDYRLMPTTIINSTGDVIDGVFFSVTGAADKHIRFSGIAFLGNVSDPLSLTDPMYVTRAIELKWVDTFRIDNCFFDSFTGSAIQAWASKGLIDHCVIDDTFAQHVSGHPPNEVPWGYGIQVVGDCQFGNTWMPLSSILGQWTTGYTYQAGPIYIENCNFSMCRHAIVAQQAGFYCARYNAFLTGRSSGMAYIDIHGWSGGAGSGGRGIEVYNNTVYASIGMFVRGGGGVIYNNTYISCSDAIELTNDDFDGNYSYYEFIHDLWIWDNSFPSCYQSLVNQYNQTRPNIDYFSDIATVGSYPWPATATAPPRPGYVAYSYPHPLTTGTEGTTNSTVSLSTGTYSVTVPSQVVSGAYTYNFVEWQDASTNTTITVSLTVNTTITATYFNTLVQVSITSPTNTTYTNSQIPINFTASALSGTIDKKWYNCKNASSWIYGSNQTYSVPTSMTGFINGSSYAFYAWANSTFGAEGSSIVMFSVTIYGLEVTIASPTNTTYSTSNITVTFSAVGGTIEQKWFNCKNGSSWIYGSNQTYTVSVNMTGFVNGTSYTFFAFANNTLGDVGYSNVSFSVGIFIVPPTDLSYVAVSLNSPVNGYSTTSTVITFTYTPYTTSTFENASLYLNVSGTWQSAGLNTTAILNNTVNSWTYMFLTYGTFSWNIQVYNTTDYAFANANFTLTLTAPTLPPSTGNVFYFCPDTQTINTVTGYKLSETQPNGNASASISASGNLTGYIGYRVFIVYDDGTMFEISSGYIAITGRTNDTEGLINATWTCPKTQLNVGFQALRVEMYMQIGSGGWIDKATFISGFLNETEITASTWIFQTYTKHAYTGGSTIMTATWGTSIANSLIDNVGVTDPGIYDLLIYQLNVGNFVGFIFMPYTNLVGNLFYGLLLLVFFVPLYNRYKSFSPIIILLILFGGAGGILSLMVPEAGLGISWIFLVVGIGGLIYKVFR